jgi:hypothetical protein
MKSLPAYVARLQQISQPMNAEFMAVDNNYPEIDPKSFRVLAVQWKDVPQTGSFSDLFTAI